MHYSNIKTWFKKEAFSLTKLSYARKMTRKRRKIVLAIIMAVVVSIA